jgi:hypothetical protein
MSSNDVTQTARPGAPVFEDCQLFAASERPAGAPKQVAALFSWMGASPRQLRSYVEHLNAQGFDVLWLHTRIGHVLRPNQGRRLVTRLLELLRSPAFAEHQWMIYAFSNGGYMIGQMLQVARSSPAYGGVMERLIAQVYDSLGDWHCVPRGVGLTLARSRVGRALLTALTWCLLIAAYPLVTRKLVRSAKYFRTMLPPAAALVHASRADEVVDLATIREVVQLWQARGVPVRFQLWDDTPHVQHARRHPEEYFAVLASHLEACLSAAQAPAPEKAWAALASSTASASRPGAVLGA